MTGLINIDGWICQPDKISDLISYIVAMMVILSKGVCTVCCFGEYIEDGDYLVLWFAVPRPGNPTSVFWTPTDRRCSCWEDRAAGGVRTCTARTTSNSRWDARARVFWPTILTCFWNLSRFTPKVYLKFQYVEFWGNLFSERKFKKGRVTSNYKKHGVYFNSNWCQKFYSIYATYTFKTVQYFSYRINCNRT